MKNKASASWLATLILALILSACQAHAVATPTPSAVPPTATLAATATPSPVPPTATATLTPTPVPPTATHTATPDLDATATKQAVLDTATALAGQTVILNDTFDTVAHGWWVGTSSDKLAKGTLSIKEGKYHWEVQARQAVIWPQLANTTIPADFTYSVDVQKLNGPVDSDFGLVFRGSDNRSVYYFAISDSGQFAIFLINKGEWKILRDWAKTDAINAGQSNHLAVVATGSQFRFFINDQYMAAVEDNTLARGRIGLAVQLYFDEDQATIEFDNVSVRGNKAGPVPSGGSAATQAPAPTLVPTDSGPSLGRLVIYECADIENTITIFKDGQIVKQESLHSKDANVYLLPPGHYDVQFNAVGYYNLNYSYDIKANAQVTQYLDGNC